MPRSHTQSGRARIVGHGRVLAALFQPAPLVIWRLSGREVCWRGLGSVACIALGVALGALGAGWLAVVPMNVGALLAIMFLSGGFRAWRHRRNASERLRRKGTG
jgi:hypothetical protein